MPISHIRHEGKDPFVIQEIRKRFERNKNWLAVCCGETGSGKSYSALHIAETIDPSFNAKRVVWSVQEFLALLNTDTLKRGNMIVFDEAGVGSEKPIHSDSRLVQYFQQGVFISTPNVSS